MLKIIGKVGVTPKGNYNTSTSYEKLDLVRADGGSYISLTNDNLEPLSNTLAWAISTVDGVSYKLQSDNIATYANLPVGLTLADANKGYTVQSDINGKQAIYVWDGVAFPADGNGLIGGFVAGISVVPDVFEVVDSVDNTAFRVDAAGQTSIAKFSPQTENIIKGLVGSGFDKIRNKKISILGDSISTSNGAAGIATTDTYYGRLIALQGCTVYVNAVSDSCITSGGSAAEDFTADARWSALSASSPDIIIIFGGINDFLQDRPLGTIGDTDKSASFYGGLDYLYKSILNANPNARVFHNLPCHTTYSTGGGLIPEYNGVNYLTDYINAIELVAKRYGVGIINTFQNSGMTCYNINTYAPSDGIHFEEAGHFLVYQTIVSETNILL